MEANDQWVNKITTQYYINLLKLESITGSLLLCIGHRKLVSTFMTAACSMF